MPKEKIEKAEKLLGKSIYKNSKQKKKIQQKKLIEAKKVVSKDRQLKVKIKHLEKELVRIEKAVLGGIVDKKISEEKLAIEKKMEKLRIASKKVIKRV